MTFELWRELLEQDISLPASVLQHRGDSIARIANTALSDLSINRWGIIQCARDKISTSNTPAIMPVTALLVLCAINTASASANPRRGAASASKRAPTMKSVIEIMLQIRA